MLNAYEYDDSEFQGPPRNLPRDEVFNLNAGGSKSNNIIFPKIFEVRNEISQDEGQE